MEFGIALSITSPSILAKSMALKSNSQQRTIGMLCMESGHDKYLVKIMPLKKNNQ